MTLKKNYQRPEIIYCELFRKIETVLTVSGPIIGDGGFYIEGYDFETKWWE